MIKHQTIIIQANQEPFILNKNENNPVAYFGEVHPNILKKN